MEAEQSEFERTAERLVRLTLSQHLSRPSRHPNLNQLSSALKKWEKSSFSIGINEGDLFKTCYYEDIEMQGLNVARRVEPAEIQRCLNPKVAKPGQGLQEFVRSCVHDESVNNQYPPLGYSKGLQYHFKSLSRKSLQTDLTYWTPFYCEVCQQYDTWDHPQHLNNNGRSIRRPVQLKSFNLLNQLQRLKIDSQIVCEEQRNCILFNRQKMIRCAYAGEADSHLLQINDRANAIYEGVMAELEKIKCALSQQVSYCMLRVMLWGSCGVAPEKPSCLELYFCVRKIIGEPTLDLHVLERNSAEMEVEEIELAPAPTEAEQLQIVEAPPKPPKYFLSKSNVCDGGGIFTLSPIKRGTTIGSYLGEILTLTDPSVDLRSRYQDLMKHSSYSFQSKNNVDIDSAFYGNFTRMLNHMPVPMANCRFIKNEADVIVVTFRDILPGEELFVDYGTSYTEPWKEEFDKKIKALKNMKSIKEGIMAAEISKDTHDSGNSNGQQDNEAPIDKLQPKHGKAVCRKSNVTVQKQIEVIELQ